MLADIIANFFPWLLDAYCEAQRNLASVPPQCV